MLAMGTRSTIVRILILWSLYCLIKTSPSVKEWFWGIVLVLLLAIGCVEMNPGPNQGNNRPSSRRRRYGSMDGRNGQLERQHEARPRFSVCWPFMFWCKTQPLPDEEGLLGRQTARQQSSLRFREDSEDDELLQVDSGPPDTTENRRESEANLAIDLLKQQVGHLTMQLEREVNQRKDERKCYEDTICEQRQTQEQSRRLHDELYGKLEEENRHLKQQVEQTKREKDQMISEETNRLKVQLVQELEQQKNLQLQVVQIKQEKEQCIEDIKMMYTELKMKLDEAVQQKKLLEEQIEELRKEKEDEKRETERICKELQEKLVMEITEKEALVQQMETLKHNNKLYNAEDQVGKLNKEFKRRKQLEKELEKQILEQKTLTGNLQEEMEQRQQLEQQLRFQMVKFETARREFDELNQEQEIQRRQLQHAVEQERIRNQEISQQLEHEVKHKQDLFRKLLKETEERHRLELQLEREILTRQEVELELKSEILKQHEPEHLFSLQGGDNIEIISDSEESESVTEEVSEIESDYTNKDDETFEEAEEAENIDNPEDSNTNDDEEKQEIRQLLLEEFKRLQSESEKQKNSTNTDTSTVEDNESAANSEIIDENFSSSSQGFFLDGVNERNFIEVERHLSICGTDIHDDEPTEFIYQDELDEVFEQSDIINRGNEYLTMTLISEDELDSPSPRRKGILLKKGETPQLNLSTQGEDCVDFPRAPKQSKLIHFQYADVLEETVTFQGKDVTVSSLLGESLYPQMEPILYRFRNLFKNGIKPVIGFPFSKGEDYYIPRRYFRKIYIKPEIFRQKSSRLPTAFAISGMTKLELEELIPPGELINQRNSSSGIDNAGWRFHLLNEKSTESEYRDLCEMGRNFKAIHWLEKKGDGLIWRQSKGNIDVIRHHIDIEKTENVFSIPTLEDRIIILTGSNGDGKTICLKKLTNDLKDADPSSWVIRINANDLLSYTKKHDLTKESVTEFLLSAVKASSSPIDRQLLQQSLEITGNVILLVDEINHKLQDKIQSMFDILKNMKIKKLVIAAHKCMQECLENTLSAFSLHLKPLDKDELQDLLVHSWKSKNENVNIDEYKKFATLVLNSIEKSLGNSFSLTPQNIIILASVYEQEVSESFKSFTTSLPKCLNIFEVYDKFLEVQCELYCSTSSSANSNDLKSKFYQELTYAAMLSIFSESQMNHVIIDFLKKFSDELKDVKCETNQFSFFHQELQDYIVAKWFAENYHDHTQVIEETYFETDFQSMWEIFDHLLAKENELHIAVLNKNIEKLRNILSTRRSELNSVDMGGRSALHLASILWKHHLENSSDDVTKCIEIVSILLSHDTDVSIKDSVLNWTPLTYADRVRCWPLIEELLKADSDVADMMFTNSKLDNALFLQETLTEAAMHGYVHITAFMLDAGADINMPLHSSRYSHQQYGLVHIASENNQMTLLEFLLDSGAQVNKGNWNNSTPLHLASRYGKTESVKLLLKRKANVEITNKIGDTPLHEAVRGSHSEIVDMLIKNDADANAYNNYYETPFHIACRRNDLASVSYLLERKINNSIRNRNGDSPLECAIMEGHTTLVRYILGKCRQCLTVRHKDNRHPLHLAAMKGDVLMLDYLLQVVPEVDLVTYGGDTLLHLASLHSKVDAAEFLLKKGADVNKLNNCGNTALHLSSLKGNINVMKVLLEYQAEVNARNSEGNTPLHLASLQGKKSAISFLLKHGSDVYIKNREKNTSLQLAVEKENLEVIKLLIDAGSDVNAIDRYGNSMLHQAVQRNRADIIKILTDTGQCKMDIKNSKGDSPLLTAMRYEVDTSSKIVKVVETLVSAGADVNFADTDGNTPLYIATSKENMELMKLLIESGANLNVTNLQGNTPLHRATHLMNYSTIIEFLVNCGANKKIQNSKGYTPFDLGVEVGISDNILQIL